MSLTQPECVCICSLDYAAHNAHAPYRHLWPASLHNIFPHYLINGAIFGKNVTECIVRVLIFFLQTVSEAFLIFRRTEGGMTQNVYRSSCNVPFILVRF